jgi:putative ABC transport system ATP-binding protein
MSSSVSRVCVSLHNVKFSYKESKPVLDIDSLEIDRGQRVFLYGPSGSGKSTFLSMISGVLLPQEGQLSVLGQDMRQLSASQRDGLRGNDIGYIFQGFNLISYLTVMENIALPCVLHRQRRNRLGERTLDAEVRRISARLDILNLLHVPVQSLSVGQQQRVAIARAVIGMPPLVIADEPTSSLDADRRDAFLTLLNEMVDEAKSTLIFVSHDMSLASHFKQSIFLPTLLRREGLQTQ